MLSPYARINAAWLTLDAFTETRGLGGALTYSSQTVQFYTSVLGLRGKYTFLTDWGSIAPRFCIEYDHDFAGTSTIFLQYADLIGPIYSLTTSPASRDRATVGVGTDLMIKDTPSRVRLSIRRRFSRRGLASLQGQMAEPVLGPNDGHGAS